MSTLLSLLLASALNAAPTATTGGDVIKAMYAQFPFAGDSILAAERSVQAKYLDDELIALLEKDSACQEREQGICNIEADPIYHAQDAEITEMKVTAGSTPSEWIVTFKNFGEAQKLVYTMSATAAGPRVHDIDYGKNAFGDDDSLRELLSRSVP